MHLELVSLPAFVRLMASACLIACLVSGCEPTEPAPERSRGDVRGTVRTSVGGNAWVFLLRSAPTSLAEQATPVGVGAISAERLANDGAFVIPAVEPNAYRISALLDVDRDFDGTIDVLAQATAGDRLSPARRIDTQPSRGADVELELTELVETEPPAFSVAPPSPDVVLLRTSQPLVPLSIVAAPASSFASGAGLTLGLVDDDADGRPDDANGDGLPDLSLQFALHWRPKPGQLDQGEVLVPLVADASAALTRLEGRLDRRISLERLDLYLSPVAQRVTFDAAGQPRLSVFGAAPLGAYVLVATGASTQFWRLPNQLDEASQKTRFELAE